MIPIKFKESNTVYSKNQPKYLPLPAFKNEGPKGEVITCWKLSLAERLKILFTGRLWVCLLTFNGPLVPAFITINKSEVLTSNPQQ